MKNLVVGSHGVNHVFFFAVVSLDQVIAMHCRWNCGFFFSSQHKLQQGHLRCRILHRHAIWPQLQKTFSALEILMLWIIQVTE